MDGKILVFVRDYQTKRKILNCIVGIGVPFVECYEEDELSFKMQLFFDEKKLYIYEFVDEDDVKQFDKLKQIKSKGWKIIVIFTKYLIEYIDKSQAVGIDDLIIMPFETITLKNKIQMLLSLPIVDELPLIDDEEKDMEKDIDKDIDQNNDKDLKAIIQLEINRADRGKYALSFVMIDFGNVSTKFQNMYFQKLKKTLRETDVLLKAYEKNTYILICPFTPKNFLVEVENKIRQVYEHERNVDNSAMLTKLYAYGLTLGEDGLDFNEIYDRLIESIHDSKLLDQSIVRNMIYTPDRLKAYKSMFKRF